MVLGFPWDDSYLQHQQKEKSSVMFICQYPGTHQNIGHKLTQWAFVLLWDNSYSQHQQKEHSYVRFIYKSPLTHQNMAGDLPSGTWCPLG